MPNGADTAAGAVPTGAAEEGFTVVVAVAFTVEVEDLTAEGPSTVEEDSAAVGEASTVVVVATAWAEADAAGSAGAATAGVAAGSAGGHTAMGGPVDMGGTDAADMGPGATELVDMARMG